MATSTYLSNPVVTVNSVALTGFCQSAVLTRTITAADITSFGETARTYGATLEDSELTLTLYMTYAASEVYATLKSLVGTRTTVRVQPGSGVDSAVNPGMILSGSYLESLPVLQASLGEISSIDITFRGGVYSEDTTNP
jgi:hypothetical protein